MKLIAVITLKIKSGSLPSFVSSLYKHNCEINQINLIESEKKWEEYTIETIYTSRKELVSFIDALKTRGELFKEIKITSTLEDKIKGGLLKTSAKNQIETVNELETTLIGGCRLIHEKIESGLADRYTGISNSVALINGFNSNTEKDNLSIYHSYTDSERDAAILNRFTGRNAFPFVVKFQTSEDMIKTVRTIQHNFACIRFMNYNEDDIKFSSMIAAIDRPVISRDYDEYPLYLLSLIKRLTKNHRLKPGQTSVGIIGLNRSAARLTRLLNNSGFMKVLGFDNRERQMMAFEDEKGLATTPENILMNTDILLIMDDTFRPEMIEMTRPGQHVFSFLADDAINASAFRERGVKQFIHLDDFAISLIFPGLIQGLISAGVSSFKEESLLKISDSLARMFDENYELPDIFSDIHSKIESLAEKI